MYTDYSSRHSAATDRLQELLDSKRERHSISTQNTNSTQTSLVVVVFEHAIDVLIKQRIESSIARAYSTFLAFFFCKNSHLTEFLPAQTPDKMRSPMLTGTRDRLKRARVATLSSYCERVMQHNPCALQVPPQTIFPFNASPYLSINVQIQSFT